MKTEKKTVLITGVNGFIGKNLASFFKKQKVEIVGIDRGDSPDVVGIYYYKADLIQDNILRILEECRPDIIFHCAGAADVSFSELYPDEDLKLNFEVPRRLLYAIKESIPNAKIALMSSAAVYGDPIKNPIAETAQYNPISPYALHKVLMEDTAEYFSRIYNLNISVLRIFSAYGNGLTKQVFWDMGQKVKTCNQLYMGGNGNETRDFIHIDDLVRAIGLIADVSETGFHVYNVANGEEISIRKIADMFVEKMQEVTGNEQIDIVFSGETRKGNPSKWKADIEKLKVLGYAPKVSIEEGIARYVRWLYDTKELQTVRKEYRRRG